MLGYASRDLDVQHAKASNAPTDELLAKVKAVAQYFEENAGRGVFETGDKDQLPRFQRLHGLPLQEAAE
jgi:hypothetical protein